MQTFNKTSVKYDYVEKFFLKEAVLQSFLTSLDKQTSKLL